MVASLAESLALAKLEGNDPARCGYDLCKAIVIGVREGRVSRPDLVVKYGQYLLQKFAGRLGHEVWPMYEQTFVALLQYASAPDGEGGAAAEMAQEYLSVLRKQFPNSNRTKRLGGMLMEAQGQMRPAMACYDEVLAAEPANLHAVKRQVALCRSRGRNAEAAKKLTVHLDTFCGDTEAWLLLCEIYISQQLYRRAQFCMEELLLLNPMSYLYHLRYAELLYTVASSDRGSHEQFLTARKYFAHALELKPGCARALYGLMLCCSVLTAAKAKICSPSATQDLLELVERQLLEAYAADPQSRGMLKLVNGMLKKARSS